MKLYALLSVVLLLPIGAGSANAQLPPPKPLVLSADGPELFKSILHDRGLRPGVDLNEAVNNPERSVIVLMGGAMPIAELNALQDFTMAGGAVLFASDLNCEELIPICGAFITGKMVRAQPVDCYQGSSDFPLVHGIALNRPTAAEKCFRHSDSKPFARLASNRPSGILKVPFESPIRRLASSIRSNPSQESQIQQYLQAVAGYGPSARWDGVLQGSLPPAQFPLGEFDGRQDFAALAAELPNSLHSGRMMLVADHSIFLNQLLVRSRQFSRRPDQADLDNFEFSGNLVDWLIEGPNGRREICHFVFYEIPQTEFELPTSDMPLPPLENLANMALDASNKVTDSLQSQNFFNKLLTEKVSWSALVRNWLLFAAFALLIRLLWRLWNARSDAAKGRLQAPRTLQRDLDDPRERAALYSAQDDYYPAARSLVRSRFTRLDGGSHGDISLDRLLRRLPWYAFSLRSDLRTVWTIGFGSKPRRMRGRTLHWLIGRLQAIETRIAARQPADLPSPSAPVPQRR